MTSVHDGEDTLEFMQMVKRRWGLDRLRSGIGSFIAVRNVRSGRFDRYDGVFVADGGTGHAAEPGRAQADDRSAMTLPSGEYLCGYHRGVWSGLPDCIARCCDMRMGMAWSLATMHTSVV